MQRGNPASHNPKKKMKKELKTVGELKNSLNSITYDIKAVIDGLDNSAVVEVMTVRGKLWRVRNPKAAQTINASHTRAESKRSRVEAIRRSKEMTRRAYQHIAEVR